MKGSIKIEDGRLYIYVLGSCGIELSLSLANVPDFICAKTLAGFVLLLLLLFGFWRDGGRGGTGGVEDMPMLNPGLYPVGSTKMR